MAKSVASSVPPQFAVGYSTLYEPEMSQQIIDIMNVHNIHVDPQDPNFLKCFIVKGEAIFECATCNGRWSSSDAKIKIDLLHQEVSKQYKQKCTSCKSWAVPVYTSDNFKTILERIMNYVSKNDHLRNQEQSSAASLLRQVPHAVACYVQIHSLFLLEALKKFYVMIDFYISDNISFIHLFPSKDAKIKDWNKVCEDRLELFLESLSKVSLSVKPEVVSKLKEVIQSEPSVYVEEQTVLQIGGDQQDVTDLVQSIVTVEQSLRKPCILPY